MQINEDVIGRALNAMSWVLEPYLEGSILDSSHLMELANSYNELAALSQDLNDSTLELSEIH